MTVQVSVIFNLYSGSRPSPELASDLLETVEHFIERLRHLFILDQHVRAREAREVVTIGRRCLLHGATITIHLDV